MKVKTIVEMSYDEFDQLVNQHIPAANGKYEFTAEEECGNDTAKTFNGIDGSFKYVEREEAEIEKGNLRNTHAVLHCLCKKGYIPAGDYVITVSW
jgi:hypothetical protein